MAVQTVSSGIDATSRNSADVLFEAWIKYAGKIRVAMARPLRAKQKPGMPLQSVIAQMEDEDQADDFVADVVRHVLATAAEDAGDKPKKFSCVILGAKAPGETANPQLCEPVVVEILPDVEKGADRETELVSVLRIVLGQNKLVHEQYVELLKTFPTFIRKVEGLLETDAKGAKYAYKQARFEYDREALHHERIDENAKRAARSERVTKTVNQIFGDDSRLFETIDKVMDFMQKGGFAAGPKGQPTHDEINQCTDGIGGDLGQLLHKIVDESDVQIRVQLVAKLQSVWDSLPVEQRQKLFVNAAGKLGQPRALAIARWLKKLGLK